MKQIAGVARGGKGKSSWEMGVVSIWLGFNCRESGHISSGHLHTVRLRHNNKTCLAKASSKHHEPNKRTRNTRQLRYYEDLILLQVEFATMVPILVIYNAAERNEINVSIQYNVPLWIGSIGKDIFIIRTNFYTKILILADCSYGSYVI